MDLPLKRVHLNCHTNRFFPKTQRVPVGTQKSFLWGSSARSPTLNLLYTIFDRKATHFVDLLLTNGTPFTYPVYNFEYLFTGINALFFKYE